MYFGVAEELSRVSLSLWVCLLILSSCSLEGGRYPSRMAKECYRPGKTGDEYEVLKGEQPAATDDEVCVYLYTATQTPDVPGLVSNVPLHCPTNTYNR